MGPRRLDASACRVPRGCGSWGNPSESPDARVRCGSCWVRSGSMDHEVFVPVPAEPAAGTCSPTPRASPGRSPDSSRTRVRACRRRGRRAAEGAYRRTHDHVSRHPAGRRRGRGRSGRRADVGATGSVEGDAVEVRGGGSVQLALTLRVRGTEDGSGSVLVFGGAVTADGRIADLPAEAVAAAGAAVVAAVRGRRLGEVARGAGRARTARTASGRGRRGGRAGGSRSLRRLWRSRFSDAESDVPDDPGAARRRSTSTRGSWSSGRFADAGRAACRGRARAADDDRAQCGGGGPCAASGAVRPGAAAGAGVGERDVAVGRAGCGVGGGLGDRGGAGAAEAAVRWWVVSPPPPLPVPSVPGGCAPRPRLGPERARPQTPDGLESGRAGWRAGLRRRPVGSVRE